MRGCGALAKGRAPDGVAAPVQYGPRAAALGVYLWHGQFLSRDRACAAMADMFGCTPSPGTLAAMAKKTAGAIAPALDAIITALIESEVPHFDETGFRVAGKLAWVHSASSGKFVLVTVHARRGREGMEAAGVLPSFAGIACHDAWKPYDCYADVAGHALCNAHLLRELAAVTETGTAGDVIWARQAIGALLELKQAADAAAAAGQDAIDTEVLEKQGRWLRDAAAAGITLNAARRSTLQKKRHALATRMRDREGDYLRFAHDLRVPFDNNEAEQVIRMRNCGQGLRLHALHDRRRDLLRHPLLPRHRQPPRHQLARRPHPRRRRAPLDPRHHLILIQPQIVSLPDPRQRGGPFLLPLLESAGTEGIFNLAEPGHRGRGPLRPPPAGTEGIVDLAELRGGQRARPLDQVVPAEGGQPGARGKARMREHKPQRAVEGQSFQDADRHFDPQAGDAGARRSDDLHRPEPGRLLFRQQHNRPSLIELDPPDLASPHVSSWAPDGRQMLRPPPLEVMQPCQPPRRPP